MSDDLVNRLADVLERRGETEGLMWGALDLTRETYLALAQALIPHWVDAVNDEIAGRYHPEFGSEWAEDGSLTVMMNEAYEAGRTEVSKAARAMQPCCPACPHCRAAAARDQFYADMERNRHDD